MTPRPGAVTLAWRRTPLWLRLVTALLVLAFVGLTLTGMFGIRLLKSYLIGRADDELRSATEAVTKPAGAPPWDQEDQQSLPSAYRYVVLDAEGHQIGEEFTAPIDGSQSPPDFPALDILGGAARAKEPFTVRSVDGEGQWRVLATTLVEPRGTLLMATSLDDADATVANLLHIDLVVGGIVLGGLAVAGTTMVRTAMRPLSDIERTAAAIARGDLSRRIADEDPRTEVGRLGRALNVMLARIEGAFHAREASETRAVRSEERMRRFVADASHELRTPLTSIRGFAELYRQGAVPDPEQVSHLLARIESEATRMGVLVEDLLQLARLDQQRPMQNAPVDLVVVAADAVEAARTRAPGRAIRLTVDVDGPGPRPEVEVAGGLASPAPAAPPEADPGDDGDEDDEGTVGVVVPGDEARLRQVVTNLVDNALQHTPAGSPVTVRVAAGQPMASVEVSDEGPGLTPEQASHVFERFYRTDTARSRAMGGTGLGLSIVAAIADAHGGSVEVDSAPGEGATFRLLLPVEAPAAPPGAAAQAWPDAPGAADASGPSPAPAAG